MKILLLSLTIFFSTISAVAQASWDYSFSFKLLDHSGNEINADHLVNKKVKVFLFANGSNNSHRGTFISTKNEFHIGAHTVSTEGFMAIVIGKDTMTIELNTHDTNLGVFQFKKGHYKLPYWGNKKEFNCADEKSECRLIKKVTDYQKSSKSESSKFNELIEVKPKLSR